MQRFQRKFSLLGGCPTTQRIWCFDVFVCPNLPQQNPGSATVLLFAQTFILQLRVANESEKLNVCFLLACFSTELVILQYLSHDCVILILTVTSVFCHCYHHLMRHYVTFSVATLMTEFRNGGPLNFCIHRHLRKFQLSQPATITGSRSYNNTALLQSQRSTASHQ